MYWKASESEKKMTHKSSKNDEDDEFFENTPIKMRKKFKSGIFFFVYYNIHFNFYYLYNR